MRRFCAKHQELIGRGCNGCDRCIAERQPKGSGMTSHLAHVPEARDPRTWPKPNLEEIDRGAEE